MLFSGFVLFFSQCLKNKNQVATFFVSTVFHLDEKIQF